MQVYLLTPSGAELHLDEELPDLLAGDDGVVWVDIPSCSPPAKRVLSEVFRFHPIAIRDCVERNHVSKVHVYPDHVFTVLHSPHVGRSGHVHYIELDLLIGRNYLVTVHGPLNPKVSADVAQMDTGAVLHRIKQGHLHPQTSFHLAYAIVSSLIRREVDLVAELARESGRLEQRVTLKEVREDPEAFLEELFSAWYELLAVRTMAMHASATFGRMTRLTQLLPEGAPQLVADLVDQFDRVASMADSQKEFLHGVIEFYQTRTDTHRTIAAEELTATAVQQNQDMRKITAWVAIIAAPTAVTGFFGQNVPYPGFGQPIGFLMSTAVIVVIAVALYVVFKHKNWL